ncbi:MAG: helix-turn-helix domain-containing protein [Nanoarchaeota archaeon]|nr:helix-turn-helix domain-containing protein [Nanoarchaeota archaeon]
MASCPVFFAAKLFGKKWTMALLDEIERFGDKGFNFLFNRLKNITPKILAKRLKELEEEGLVRKNVYANVVPMKTAYYLTDKGRDLQVISRSFKSWSKKYDVNLPCGTVDCRDCKLYPRKPDASS